MVNRKNKENKYLLRTISMQMASMNKAEKSVASVVINTPQDVINANMATQFNGQRTN